MKLNEDHINDTISGGERSLIFTRPMQKVDEDPSASVIQYRLY